jgi:hypothetical protein
LIDVEVEPGADEVLVPVLLVELVELVDLEDVVPDPDPLEEEGLHIL